MRNFGKKGDNQLWIYVGVALVVGLLIPDSMNPVKILIDKVKGVKTEEPKK